MMRHPPLRTLSGAMILALALGWAMGMGPRARADTVLLVGEPTVEATSDTATLKWTTDIEAGTSVIYGPSPERPTRRLKGRVGLQHSAILTNLQCSTRYRIVIGTAHHPLRTNEFVTPRRGTSNRLRLPLYSIDVVNSAPTGSKTDESSQGSGGSTSESLAAPPPKMEARMGGVHPPSARVSPPSRETWNNPASLPDHFARHGKDFHARDAEDYAAKAWEFRQEAALSEYLVKRDAHGVLRIYDPASGRFGVYDQDGKTRTFFRPKTADYFQRQPGVLIRLHP